MPRNLVLAIVFSFLTCGIYSIYWMIKLNDEVNQLAGEPQATSGGMVFLFFFDHLWNLWYLLGL